MLAKMIWLSVLPLCGIGAAFIWHHKVRGYHFRTVRAGVLYRSGWMRPVYEERIITKYGIRTVVNLCVPTEANYQKYYSDEQRMCARNGARLVNLPLPGNTPPSQEQTVEWLKLLSDDDNLPVLIHCDQGVIRTGIMVAIYQMEFQGGESETVFEKLPAFGHKLDVPKRKAMRDFILSYKPSGKAQG
jgi:protein tyrosine/serine phosphatase